jgi:hypothetical protein
MSLITIVQNLATTPRNQEEEYEHTSDFLEWFYQYIYREQGFIIFPILHQLTKDSSYPEIQTMCKNLINITYTKNIDNQQLINYHNNMKQWTLDTLKKYNCD